MIEININISEDETVELIQVLSLLDVYSPNKAKSVRAKLQYALREGITMIEYEAFSKAVDKFLKK